MIARSEGRFVGAIDARFPYRDATRAEALIDEAFAISNNAVMIVVSELVHPPHGRRRPHPAQSISRLRRIQDRLRDPTLRAIVDAAIGRLAGRELDGTRAATLMDHLAKMPDCWAALAIVEGVVADNAESDIEERGERIRVALRAASPLEDSPASSMGIRPS